MTPKFCAKAGLIRGERKEWNFRIGTQCEELKAAEFGALVDAIIMAFEERGEEKRRPRPAVMRGGSRRPRACFQCIAVLVVRASRLL